MKAYFEKRRTILAYGLCTCV